MKGRQSLEGQALGCHVPGLRVSKGGAFGWGGGPNSSNAHREKTEVLSSDDDAPDSPVILEVPPLPASTPGYIPTYKKSLRLSSDQIVSVCVHMFLCGGTGLC